MRDPSRDAVSQAMQMATSKSMHAGPLQAPVGGRTDHLPISVASGSYVVPADVVSAVGEHNTLAGFKILDQMFKAAPYGAAAPKLTPGKGMGMPGEKPAPRADGGRTPVDIIAAGGEYVIPPEAVAALGEGDMDRGHAILDQWVKQRRAHSIKTLRKLPGPRRD